MPLKKVPFIISPELLKVLCEMGHGDTIVFADAQFPTSGLCRQCGAIEVRADGHAIPPLLAATLELFPLDDFVFSPVSLMQVVESDQGKVNPSIWDAYKAILQQQNYANSGIEMIERFQFYEKAKRSYAIVHTGEMSQYGNIILQKGIVYN